MRALAYIEFLISSLIFLIIFWNIFSKIINIFSFVGGEYRILSEFFLTYQRFNCKLNYPFIIYPGNSIIKENCVNFYKDGNLFCILNNEKRSVAISLLVENKSGIYYYSIVLGPLEKYCIPNNSSAVYISKILAGKVCIGNKEFFIGKLYSYYFIDFKEYPIACLIPYRI